jgi:hypothetical protein
MPEKNWGQTPVFLTNASRGAGRGGILVNVVQVFLSGRDYGN